MHRCIFLSFIFAFSYNTIIAQSDHYEWDFGDISEDKGYVEHVFSMVNNTLAPIVITGVHSSCGCTTTSYTEKPIIPREQWFINVQFNPIGLAGVVNKHIIVKLNNGKRMVFTIKGNILPHKKTVEELYRIKICDAVRADQNVLLWGYVYQNQKKYKSIKLINVSYKDILIDVKRIDCKSVHPKLYVPKLLKPNIVDSIVFEYFPRLDYGIINNEFQLIINGKASNVKVQTKAIFIDDFNETTHPKIKISDFFIRLNSLKYKSITISNTGDAPLIIRDIDCQNKIMINIKPGDIIYPGETKEYSISINSSNTFTKIDSGYIILTVNDPIKPINEIYVISN